MSASSPSLLVIAKAPRPGRSKTRLCPPCTPREAADLAEAALSDTLTACLASSVARRVLVLDGEPGEWLPDGFEVIAQRGAGLEERLAAAFEDAGTPALLVGMDTPQVTPELLEAGLAALADHDAVYAPAEDGGYWAIGLQRADPRVFENIPMSEDHTGAVQLERLEDLGLSIAVLPELLDVDTIAAARAVAAAAPHTRFASRMAAVDQAPRDHGVLA